MQALIDAEAVWHDQLALQREVLAHKSSSVVQLQVVRLQGYITYNAFVGFPLRHPL